MKTRWLLVALLLGLGVASSTHAQAPILPPGDKEPLLRLEAGGPTSFVTALAFSPDGKQLYAGGWDKVVRVWSLNERGQFVPSQATYRVPIGPGLSGAINCIALSPDGNLLAVAGQGVFREEAGFRLPGLIVPSLGLSDDMQRDRGTIYLFDTRTQAVRLLRAHRGVVLSLAFAPGGPEVPPVLISAARERDPDTGAYDGVIRAWNADSGEELAGISEQPNIDVRPSLAVWRTGRGAKDLQVSFAWDEGTVKEGVMHEGTLRVWNVARGTIWKEKDGVYNTALTHLPGSGKLISTSFEWITDQKAEGRLRTWSYSPEGGLKLDGPTATLPFQDRNSFVPRAVVVVPSAPVGKTDRIAPTGKTDGTVPGQPDRFVPRQPDRNVPGQPDRNVPGKTGPIVPGKTDRIAPGKPNRITPRQQPARIVPGQPARIVPEQPGRIVPGQPGRIVPGQPIRIVPGQPNRSASPAGIADQIVSGTADRIGTGKTHRIAVAYGVFSPGKKNSIEYRLRLLDSTSLKRIDGFQDFSLWTTNSAAPVMAASSQGYLAVAGNASHRIHVYSVKNLLNNQTEPQIIHSVGSTFRYVSFVTKAKDLGLLLSETTRKKPGQAPRDPVQGDLIFDFSKQPLTGDIREWTTSAPVADGWQARLSAADGRHLLSIFQGENLVREIKMVKDLAVTDFALLPPRPPLNTPILAVASHDLGQPMLQLYNGKTGEQIRQLTGHGDPISCLAFSADGRLLASVAEDQTVCVWSLTNLDNILGKRGLLPGVALKDQKGDLVVGMIHDDSPARGKLAVGEVIEGLVENEKVRALKSAYDFYFGIAKIKPGTSIALRVRGKDGGRDVPLQVGQGIDERKPLFSLFVTKADRQWVGWNPIGRFESSGPKAETYVGWHFNTGEADGPTRFALAGEYHKKYYQEGVLKDLVRVDQGEIKKLPPPPPPPAPKLGLFIDEEGLKQDEFTERDAQGQLRLRHAKATLRISIIGRPVDTLKAVTWKMDDGAEQNVDLAQVAGQEIAVPLELRRGVHRLSVTAKAPEGPAEYSEGVTLRYQPPAPIVKYTGEKTILVKTPEFDLRAQLQSGSKDEPVQLNISQKANNKVVLNETKTYELASREPLAVSQPLKLERGSNLVEITAVNKGASGESAAAESHRIALEINYFKDAAPPVIALRGILPEVEGATQLKIEPGQPIQVHVPSIHILGDVKTAEDEDLVDAKWALGKEEAKKLTTFEAMKKTLPIDEKVELKPGLQVFRFLAKTATSPEEERTVTVDYQPLVPQVSLISPRAGEAIQGEKESTSIDVQAALDASKDRQPFQAKILVNGRELDIPAPIDESGRTVTAKNVPLKPGTNLMRVKLGNQWGSTSMSEEVVVRYLRPPRILSLEASNRKEGDAVASLEAHVFSPTPLLRESVKLIVNDVERTPQVEIPNEPSEGDIWTLRLTKVPLEANALTPTMNRIQLRVSNKEADCKEAGAAQVVYTPERPPPVAEFTQPVDNISVTRPDFKVHFQVQSKSALEQVKLLYENHPPIAVDISKAEKQTDGSYLLTAEIPLHLEPKVNTLRVEAINEGGVQDSPPLEINYLYRPVRVAIDSLVPIRPGVKSEKIDLQSGGPIALEEGRLRLRGRVLWDEADDQRLQKAKLVRVYVNGFQQLPAILDKPGDNPRERSFQTTLVLNRDQGNQIEIALPDLEKDANTRLRLAVNCGRPERSQRLHLLIVSIQDKDPKPLETQIRQAFQTANGAATTAAPKPAAFDPIYSYPSLVDYRVKPSYVYYQLVEIKNTIQRLSQIGAASSDVVAVYYRGGEAVNAQGNLFQTSLTRPGRETRESAITCDEVVGIFAETPGAQILLMDVDRKGAAVSQDQIVSWGQYYPRVGMLHYAWLQPNAPKNPGLIQAIEKAMGEATRLVELRDGVRRVASSSEDFQKKLLVYDAYVPPELEDLTVR